MEPGRCRYALLLNEAGSILDDGLICALDDGRYYCTLTTGGAARGEAWLKSWAAAWGLHVHIVNQTFALGAINVAGPRARDHLQRVSSAPIDNEALPFMHHAELEIAGVTCRVIRLGFVGELSYELHHPASLSCALWDTLSSSSNGTPIVPHGLEALRLLRLEKGHILVGQDTEFDTTPAKAGMRWAAKLDKATFVGKRELERLEQLPLERRLVGLAFDGPGAPREGAPLTAEGRIVGHVTSARVSPSLGHGVALAWLRAGEDGFPSHVVADDLRANVVEPPFLDPEGARLRG
jgi:sarcosine oxidase subunit alpha